jgi:hypothetical protein
MQQQSHCLLCLVPPDQAITRHRSPAISCPYSALEDEAVAAAPEEAGVVGW